MPVESNNLPIHLTAAGQSQQVQSAAQMHERAMSQVAAAHTQEQAKKEATDEVQSTKETENPIIQGDRKGARSFDLHERKKREEEEKAKAEKPKPPDPAGRGQVLDVQL